MSVCERVGGCLRVCEEGMTLTEREKPRPPTGLRAAGRRFWATVHERYDGLEPAEVALLTECCATVDTIAGLEAAVRKHGAMVSGSQGQQVLNPAITEARLQRAQLARLLDQLGLPTEEDSESVPDSPARRKARKAAEVRWRRRRWADAS